MRLTKTKFFAGFVLLISLVACNDSKKENVSVFPVYSFLQSQAATADSSLLPLRKIVFVNDSIRDTAYFHRSGFRAEAKEFLDLPDIASEKFAGRYTESSNYDQDLDRVIIRQVPSDPQRELVQRQEILVEPSPSGDKIRTVIIQTAEVSRDSSVEKRMIWNVDASFQVTRIRQLPGRPEETSTYRVEWNINQ